MITNESGREVRVIKLGGSLLDWPEFPQRFRAWLKLQPSAANLRTEARPTPEPAPVTTATGREDFVEGIEF